nr:putative ribonuclease H-like domain-containing protein [Tanacetum cinerariifolium]
MLLMQAQENRVALDEEQILFIAGGQDNVVDEDVDEQSVQDIALNVDNVFQANDRDVFDSDVDEAPTTQTMFMANLSSADPVHDEVSPSYDSDILSEVPDHDIYQDAICEHHEVHAMHGDVQPNYIVDSHTNHASDSNMILYDQQYKVVNASLTAELTTYKEQVKLYERRAKFELTKREQKIKEQLRIVITGRNIKEEKLKKELHSVKRQLTSTINHNKSMVEKVTYFKKDFKQKETKYLEEFLDMKTLKEKVEDKLYKQDESLSPQDESRSSQRADHSFKTNQSVDGVSFKYTCNGCPQVSRFSEMHKAFNAAQKHIAELKSDNFNLKNKTQNDDHDQNGVVEIWNRTLVEAARTMLIFSKASMFLWAKVVATACYSKHMTRDRSRLRNFMKKFIGTVRFGNDHFGAIMGYEDYVIGDSVISRHSCYVRYTDGVELIKGSRGSNLYTISVKDMMKSSPISCCLKPPKTNHGYGIVI